jgi:hypothetical protein
MKKFKLASPIYLASFLFSIVFFISCSETDQPLDKRLNEEIGYRTLSPGSYSINGNGVLEFPTDSDFHLTVTYIFSDTSDANLYTFRSSLGIKTNAIRQDEILDSIDQNIIQTSTICSNLNKYGRFIDTVRIGTDTIISRKYGGWAEFLNLNNLVKIGGYLYKITTDKTIIITDGDINKIATADQLEDSDTSNHIEIRAAWDSKCNCVLTGRSWKESQTTYTTNNNNRTISELTFTNFTTVKFFGLSYSSTVTPHWTIETFIHTQSKSGPIWICERENTAFSRQIRLKHTFTSIPSTNPYYISSNYWQQITGWTTNHECKFNFKSDHIYQSYTGSRAQFPLDGYCFAIHTFAQTANVTSPTLLNVFDYTLYYVLKPSKWPFMQGYCLPYWDEVAYP